MLGRTTPLQPQQHYFLKTSKTLWNICIFAFKSDVLFLKWLNFYVFLMVSTFVIFFIFNINLLFLQVRAFRSMVIVIPQTGFDCRGSGGLKGWWRFGSRARPPRWRKMLLKPRKNKCLRTKYVAVTAKRCSVAPRRCSHSNIIFLKHLKPCEIFAFLLSNLMSFFSNDLILWLFDGFDFRYLFYFQHKFVVPSGSGFPKHGNRYSPNWLWL